MINNCILSKDRVTLSYTKDTSLLAEEFNNYFAPVGSPTALAAEKITNDNNLQLISPSTQTIAHPTDENFHLGNVSMAEVQRIV